MLTIVVIAVISSAPAAHAQCSGGLVALTFDDGPVPETNALLDQLKAHNLRATFFVLGWNVEAYPDIAQRIVREGHALANHTWDHRDLTALTAEEIRQQLRSTSDIIKQVTGVTARFARPPYGSTNDTVRAEMARLGLTEVLWSQDSWDWVEETTTQSILDQLTLVPPGGTYLMHDRMPNTQAAIPGIAWYFRTYWSQTPICAGRLEATTNVQPVLDWFGMFFRARAAQWPKR